MNIYTANTVTESAPYLYLWQDHGTWIEEHQCFKRYLGIHNGSSGYTYSGSGVYFREEFEKRPHDFHRTIILHDDDYGFIKDQEMVVLEFVKASSNAAYYNATNGPFWGHEISAETKAKMSAAQKGKTHSAETKAKMSAARKGRVISDEHRVKLSAARKGKTFSAEHKAKLSAAKKGMTLEKKLCSHCDRSFDPGNFAQHHGDKCKLNPDNELLRFI